jgi:hypothetical protein
MIFRRKYVFARSRTSSGLKATHSFSTCVPECVTLFQRRCQRPCGEGYDLFTRPRLFLFQHISLWVFFHLPPSRFLPVVSKQFRLLGGRATFLYFLFFFTWPYRQVIFQVRPPVVRLISGATCAPFCVSSISCKFSDFLKNNFNLIQFFKI